MKMHKKGQVMDNLGALGIGIVTLAIVLVVAFMIMAQAKTNMTNDDSACPAGTYYINASTGCCANDNGVLCAGANLSAYSLAWNATGTLQTATSQVPGWVPIIVITAIGSILIGMVMMFRR